MLCYVFRTNEKDIVIMLEELYGYCAEKNWICSLIRNRNASLKLMEKLFLSNKKELLEDQQIIQIVTCLFVCLLYNII